MTQEELQQAKPTFSNVEEAKSTFFQGISSFAKLGTDLLEIADIPFYIALDNDDRNATPEERKKLREELINRVDLIGSKIYKI